MWQPRSLRTVPNQRVGVQPASSPKLIYVVPHCSLYCPRLGFCVFSSDVVIIYDLFHTQRDVGWVTQSGTNQPSCGEAKWANLPNPTEARKCKELPCIQKVCGFSLENRKMILTIQKTPAQKWRTSTETCMISLVKHSPLCRTTSDFWRKSIAFQRNLEGCCRHIMEVQGTSAEFRCVYVCALCDLL